MVCVMKHTHFCHIFYNLIKTYDDDDVDEIDGCLVLVGIVIIPCPSPSKRTRTRGAAGGAEAAHGRGERVDRVTRRVGVGGGLPVHLCSAATSASSRGLLAANSAAPRLSLAAILAILASIRRA